MAYSQLRDKPEDPIGRIMNIPCRRLNKKDKRLAQAFLCCDLARNYFAHHVYLDHELIRSDKSAFMLTSILITVLVLLR
ncbi:MULTISPECIES: hypothetical protein [Methylomonas]|uniref:Transposase n=1 Tax=Methylomonas methanica TaxID=421 RepID=A0ABY2CPM0_METMH|nr:MULTISPECIES: hypothetical protein [Methylomonas]TCV85666.1 hypothetical protein EDE11_105228 [Methylomonas methanica]